MKISFCILVVCVCLFQAGAEDVKKDIPYAEPAEKLRSLDIYAPPNAKSLPVVFWIHGGGWQWRGIRTM